MHPFVHIRVLGQPGLETGDLGAELFDVVGELFPLAFLRELPSGFFEAAVEGHVDPHVPDYEDESGDQHAKLKGIVPSVALKKKGAKEPLPKPWFPPDKVMRGGHYFGTPYVWYYELTGDKLFLDRLKAMTGGNVLRHSLGNYRMWSYALWFAQGGQLPGRPGLAER